GSAPDIAGKGVANPIAAVLSAAMMLDHWQEAEAAASVREGVEAVLSSGMRTADIADDLHPAVGTKDVGRRIAEHVSAAEKIPS
ncbi:MAG: isocitrate/isopropylmalate family dehydrogenase, partial [Rhodothermales bacterium]